MVTNSAVSPADIRESFLPLWSKILEGHLQGAPDANAVAHTCCVFRSISNLMVNVHSVRKETPQQDQETPWSGKNLLEAFEALKDTIIAPHLFENVHKDGTVALSQLLQEAKKLVEMSKEQITPWAIADLEQSTEDLRVATAKLSQIAGGSVQGKVWHEGATDGNILDVFQETLDKVNNDQIVKLDQKTQTAPASKVGRGCELCVCSSCFGLSQCQIQVCLT